MCQHCSGEYTAPTSEILLYYSFLIMGTSKPEVCSKYNLLWLFGGSLRQEDLRIGGQLRLHAKLQTSLSYQSIKILSPYGEKCFLKIKREEGKGKKKEETWSGLPGGTSVEGYLPSMWKATMRDLKFMISMVNKTGSRYTVRPVLEGVAAHTFQCQPNLEWLPGPHRGNPISKEKETQTRYRK